MATTIIECLECGEQIELSGKKKGDRVNCPACNTTFAVVDYDGEMDIDYPEAEEGSEES